MLAPLVIFVYARPDHTVKTIESLSKNVLAKETEIYIYSDGAKNGRVKQQVELVRKYIDNLEKRNLFKSIFIYESDVNKGLAGSVISGVTDVIKKYGRAIVLEDDLVSAPDFLAFMNDALDFYKDNNEIWSICGYTPNINIPPSYKHDIYLSYRGGSWGWATWSDRWEKIDWDVDDYQLFVKNKKLRAKFNRGGRDMATMLDDQMQGKIDSWAIRWCYAQSKRGMFTVYPIVSRIKNIGLDGTGTHGALSSKYESTMSNGLTECRLENVGINEQIVKSFRDQFGTGFDCNLIAAKKRLKVLLTRIATIGKRIN